MNLIRPEYFQYVELCDEIINLCDDVPERGEEFAWSVAEKVESIKASIQKACYATDAQVAALKNMKSGVLRWLD